jgi:hypothetical protein
MLATNNYVKRKNDEINSLNLAMIIKVRGELIHGRC